VRETQASLFNDSEVFLCIFYVLSPKFRSYLAPSDLGCKDFQIGEAAVECNLEGEFGIQVPEARQNNGQVGKSRGFQGKAKNGAPLLMSKSY
jgi:hypothetical protein